MEPGRLLASGRDGDIFDFGPGLVLRRTRDGRSLAWEARVIEYVREHGYPAPALHELRAHDTELVMERIDGPIMLDAILRHLWRYPHYAAVLADLHDQLHEIPAPDDFRQLPDGGNRLVHMDLHPLNIIMSERGPVVVDWTNAARGEGLSDVALTYVLLTAPRMPGPAALRVLARPLRNALAHAFVRRYRGPDLDERIATMADLKSLDRSMDASEIASLQKLAARRRRTEQAG
jgi:aminoglycoside phosphotransferase (APT) family kinase protein